MTKHYLLLLVVFLLLSNLHADGIQPIGAGTVNDPYQISSLDNLLWISTTPDSWSSHFIQTADIDASASINMNNGNGFPPIGDVQFSFHAYVPYSPDTVGSFTGTYNGQNYCIDDMHIGYFNSNRNCTGLFSGIEFSTIENLNLTNANITGMMGTGAIAGSAYVSQISNCSLSGAVDGNRSIGGLIGVSYESRIIDCNVSIEITGGDFIGGFVGCNYNSNIRNCSIIGTIIGNNFLGGISGEIRNLSIINNCVSYVSVQSNKQSSYIGGIVGINYGSTVSYCSNYGDISFGSVVGGIVGYNWNNALVTNCTNRGGVSFINSYAGGIVGYNEYSRVSLSQNQGGVSGEIIIGGIVGMQGGISRIQNCSNNAIISGNSKVGGILGELMNGTIMTNCFNQGEVFFNDNLGGGLIGSWNGFPQIFENNFYNESLNPVNEQGFNKIGSIDSDLFSCWIENSLAIDIDDYFERSGVEYVIATIDDLRLLNAFSQSDHRFILANSINLANEPDFFIPYFSGEFNGNGNSILHPDIQEANAKYIGLFGYLNNADIHNLGIVDSNVVGQENVGGLAGLSYNSQIRNCYVTGSVSGSGSVGGLIGGSNSSDIEYCYSTCMVNGDSQVGGLVGFNNERSVLSSFWNIDTSGYTESGGGIGLTSNEMRTLSTYLNSGWDFINEIKNGTNDYWEMNFMQNNGYPYLIPQVVTSTEDDQSVLEQPFLSALIGNYPNPFNPETTVIFTIAKSGNVDLSIYNLKGQRVRTLANRQFLTGEHSLIWNGTDDSDTSVGSGIYFYKLSIDNLTVSTKKCILMK